MGGKDGEVGVGGTGARGVEEEEDVGSFFSAVERVAVRQALIGKEVGSIDRLVELGAKESAFARSKEGIIDSRWRQRQAKK